VLGLGKSDALAFATVHTPDACERQEKYVWTLWRAARSGKSWDLTFLATGEADDTMLDAVDLDGNGDPEVITDRGIFRAGKYHLWIPDRAVYWPAGLGCDGCEGEDCGD
jgi:hypothetical protein